MFATWTLSRTCQLVVREVDHRRAPQHEHRHAPPWLWLYRPSPDLWGVPWHRRLPPNTYPNQSLASAKRSEPVEASPIQAPWLSLKRRNWRLASAELYQKFDDSLTRLT